MIYIVFISAFDVVYFFQFMVLNVMSFVLDIVFLGIFTPHAHAYYESDLGGGKNDPCTHMGCFGRWLINM